MKNIAFVFFALILPLHSAQKAEGVTKKQMLAEIDHLQSLFETQYAPREWKREYFNWNLKNEVDRAKNKVNTFKDLSLQDYQRILRDFITSTRDLHVGVKFVATEQSSLPFQIVGSEGRYFVSWVNKKKEKTLKLGDEVLTFDGKPIQTALEAFCRTEFGPNNDDTQQRLATLGFGRRFASCAHKIPNGSVNIGLANKNVTVEWEHTREYIAPIPVKSPIIQIKENISIPIFETLRVGMVENFCYKENEGCYGLGQRESFVPILGDVRWSSGKSHIFHAYIYVHPSGKKIGYIRIPNFSPVWGEKMPGWFSTNEDWSWNAFEELVEKFETSTDALVIDMVDNPGGVHFYGLALLSHLTDKPLALPRERVSISQVDVQKALYTIVINSEFLEYGTYIDNKHLDIFGYPFNSSFLKEEISYGKKIIENWENYQLLTEPLHWNGIEVLKPAKFGRYSKPLMVLINECSISMADYFAAVLQDNQRATLFGKRTAGAGGAVDICEFPNRFGIQEVRFTSTIVERVNSQPIENLGVTPNIPYDLTPIDLVTGNAGYKDAVNDALEQLFR